MPKQHVCPVWIGYFLASPIRKLFQNPDKLLLPFVREDMTVLDVGSAMGFFSIPMARMVGPSGRVVCVDLQQKMLDVLMKRAHRAGVADRIIPHRCGSESLEIDEYTGTIDFALASAVVHEVPSVETFFREVYAVLKPGGALFVTEPSGHVSPEMFNETVEAAENSGMIVRERAMYSWYHQGVFEKK